MSSSGHLKFTFTDLVQNGPEVAALAFKPLQLPLETVILSLDHLELLGHAVEVLQELFILIDTVSCHLELFDFFISVPDFCLQVLDVGGSLDQQLVFVTDRLETRLIVQLEG